MSTMPRVHDRRGRMKKMLHRQRGRILADLQTRMRGARAGGPHEVLDEGDASVANTQESIEFALLQMGADTLGHIDEALARLATSEYGRCVSCGERIAAKRLRVLPFARRCVGCEDRCEKSGMAHHVAGATGSAVEEPSV